MPKVCATRTRTHTRGHARTRAPHLQEPAHEQDARVLHADGHRHRHLRVSGDGAHEADCGARAPVGARGGRRHGRGGGVRGKGRAQVGRRGLGLGGAGGGGGEMRVRGMWGEGDARERGARVGGDAGRPQACTPVGRRTRTPLSARGRALRHRTSRPNDSTRRCSMQPCRLATAAWATWPVSAAPAGAPPPPPCRPSARCTHNSVTLTSSVALEQPSRPGRGPWGAAPGGSVGQRYVRGCEGEDVPGGSSTMTCAGWRARAYCACVSRSACYVS